MYEEPRINYTETYQVNGPCESCAACVVCLVSPTPDLELIALQALWNVFPE